MALIAPSILTADWLDLGAEIDRVERADLLHLDVMDGLFVPNISFGPAVVGAAATRAAQPVECHLMIERPGAMLERFALRGVRRLIVHPEATDDLGDVVRQIHALGCEAGVAINPETPLARIDEVAEQIELLLVMTVHPGFGGQAFMHEPLEKVRTARRRFPNLQIEVDGGLDLKSAPLAAAAGADVLVCGSAIFRGDGAAASHLDALRAAISVRRASPKRS